MTAFLSTQQATSRGRRVTFTPSPSAPSMVTTSFAEFHAANPHIYREFERRALALLEQGATRIAVAKLREEIRADVSVRTLSTDYKLSNTYTPDYARMLVTNHPALGKLIKLNHRKEDGR